MKSMRGFLLAASALMLVPASANAHSDVIASIKPVHSLVAAVMEGVGEPELIIDGAGSPHTYALKPSQAADLEKAGLVFWVGPNLEAFLEKPIETIGSKAVAVELMKSHDLVRLDLREGGTFEGHDHGDHGHGAHGHEEAGHEGHDHAEKHDDHAHEGHDHAEKHDDHDHAGHDHAEKHDDHDHAGHDHAEKHDDHAHEGHDHAAKHDDHDHAGHDHAEKHDDHAHEGHGHGDHAHGHGAVDAHVWLDPQNAKALVHEIEEALAAHDPANAAKYEANAEALMAR
ncbi:MAG: zinc ABC transporter substrate-binding protein, partial [Pseudomonadota bacterium]